MKKNSVKILFLFFSLSFCLGGFLIAEPAKAAIQLLKSKELGTIYYIDSLGLRHAFPNEITFKSWYGNNFSKAVIVPNSFLLNYPLGKNVTIRPGTYLIKVQTAPQVYAVEQGGLLREIQNESIADAIYGEDWEKRLVDLPEVFFENYIIGDPIKHDYTIPDSILYYDEISERYYYKNNGIIQPFASTKAITDNYFNLEFAISGNRNYYSRDRLITGLDKNVFNPAAEPMLDRRDCENRKLKAAVIFLADQTYSEQELENLEKIKDNIAGRFSWVTSELSSIDLNYPTIILLNDGYLLNKKEDGTTEVKNEVLNTFYDDNPDIFDFVFLFTNFKTPTENTNEIAHFVDVTNRQEGINAPMVNRAEIYGSTGKLKGIITMGNINKYQVDTQNGLDSALNVVMHEILHNWAAQIEFIDENGQRSKTLLREPDYQHWSNYAGFISPLGGSGWIDNGDGTFTNGLTLLSNTNLRIYSPLDLYLMGLLPKTLIGPIMYLEPKVEGASGNIIEASAKYVSIDQIIQASGKIKCSND